LRFSFSMTSAARSIRLSDRPWAIAASVPIEHGHTTMASAGFEPEATGAFQSSRPNTRSWPSRAFMPHAQLLLQIAGACRQGDAEFLLGDDVGGLGYQEIDLQLGLDQAFKQTQSVSHAGSA
jgi:hypothetical protein